MSDVVVGAYEDLGWSCQAWGNLMAEDMMLRAVSVDPGARSISVVVTYDHDDPFEGAPVGHWTVTFHGVREFSVVRLASEARSGDDGVIAMTVISGSQYVLFSDELTLRVDATAATVCRGDAVSPTFPAVSGRVVASETSEWTTARWVDEETRVWNYALASVSFDVDNRTVRVCATDPGTHVVDPPDLALEIADVSSFSIVSRQISEPAARPQAMDFGFVDGSRYNLYHPELVLFATVEDRSAPSSSGVIATDGRARPGAISPATSPIPAPSEDGPSRRRGPRSARC